MERQKGKLIVIDGIDGAGKATQTALLVKRLRQERVPVKTIDFPQYENNFFGALIRECLDGKRGDFLSVDPRIASILYAVDRLESSAQIRSWLEEGFVVVSDRYASANQIHQGSKIKNTKERKQFLEWLDRMEHETLGVPRPDLVIFLHVPVVVSQMLFKNSTRVRDVAEADSRHQEEALKSALDVIKKGQKWKKVECVEKGTILPKEIISEKVFAVVQKELKF